MRHRLRVGLSVSTLAAFCFLGQRTAEAGILPFDIDTFATAQAAGVPTADTAGADIWGLQRDLRVTTVSGAVAAQVTGGNLVFDASAPAGSGGDVEVVWDGKDNDATKVGRVATPLNLISIGSNAFIINVASATASLPSGNAHLVLEVLTDGGHSWIRAFPIPVASAKTYYLSYVGFVPNRGTAPFDRTVDFASVRAIRMFVRGQDMTVNVDSVQVGVATATVLATKSESHGPAVPGDTLSYTATAQGLGGDAQGVQFNDTVDANTTYVNGTLLTSPVAVNDAYPNASVAVVSSPLTVTITPTDNGVLANDRDPQTLPITVVVSPDPQTLTSARGNSVIMGSDGSFTWTDTHSLGGIPDSFTYTLANNNGDATLQDTGLVVITQTDAAPTVTSTTPVEGATIATTTAITLNFSEVVSAGINDFTINCGGIAQSFTVSGSPGTAITLTPAPAFAAGKSCTLTALAGHLEDADAIDPPSGLDADFVLHFSTNAKPTVSTIVPTNGATNVITTTTVTVTFSESVNVTGTAFKLECPTGTPVAFTNTTGTGPATSFVLTPDARLPGGAVCTATVVASQVTDVDFGEAMVTDFTSSFTVNTPPTVTTTTPADAVNNIAPNATITINFSETVTATATAFTLECPVGTAKTFASAPTLPNGTAASAFVLTPSLALPPGETCTVTVVATQVTDVTGDKMVANYVFAFKVRPQANNDTYPQTVIGHVSVNSATISYSVTTNDVSATTYTITAFDATSANGGTVSMTTSGGGMGQFTYNPPVGFTGASDTFTYTISNTAGTSTATVSVPVSGIIWFINNAGGAGDGRLGSPFNTLAAFNTINDGAAGHAKANQNVFIYESSTAYSGAVTLLSGQKLIGQDATATLSSITGLTPPSSSASFPAMNTGGQATTISSTVTMANSTTVRGLTINSAASTGLTAAGLTAANTGLTTADLIVTTTSGTAVSISGASSGTNALGFISVSSNGSANGINVQNLAGTLTVTGDGASDPANTTRGRTTAKNGGGSVTLGSGGTITNTTGAAINLSGTGSVTLRDVSLTGNSGGVNSGADGIHAVNVAGLTLDNVLISGHQGNDGLSGSGVSALTLMHTDIHTNAKTAGVEASDVWNVRLDNLTGTSAITNSLFFDALEDIFAITNNNSSLTLTVTNSEFRDTLAAAGGNVAFAMIANGSSVTTLTATGSTFKGARTTGLQYAGNGTSSGTVTVTNNIFGGTTATGDAGKQNGVDVDIAHQGAGTTLNFDVSNNTLRQGFRSGDSSSINVFLGGLSTATSLLSGKVTNNVIGIAGVANSGSDLGAGIGLDTSGDGTFTATVTNNLVQEVRASSGNVFDAGIAGAAKLNLKIRSNTFNGNAAEAGPQYGLHINNGTGVGGETSQLCMDMGANSVTMPASAIASVDLDAFDVTTTKLVGYTGGASDATAIQNFFGSSGATTPAGVNTVTVPATMYTDAGGTTQGGTCSVTFP